MLIVVLIVIVVLSLAAYRFADSMTAENRAAVRTQDAAQVRLAAVSGVHYAAAMLADPNSFNGTLGGDPTLAESFPKEVVVRASPDGPRFESRFALVAVANTGPGSWETRFGAVIDEGGKININALIAQDPSGQKLHDALIRLPNMTEDIADAIVDWVDADQNQRTNGAESSYYSGLATGYNAKDGPLNSLDELLLVRGVTPQLLYGNDRNRNGQPDDDPMGGAQLDRGWAEFLTVYGRELNVSAAGLARVNLNDSNVSETESLPDQYTKLTAALPDNQELVDFIMAYKMFNSGKIPTTGSNGQPPAAATGTASDLHAAVTTALQNVDTKPTGNKKVKTIFDLVNVRITLPKADDAPKDSQALTYDSPLADPSKLTTMLVSLLDQTTITAKIELIPRVNALTAPREVLIAILYMTDPNKSSTSSAPANYDAEADAIISARAGLAPGAAETLSGAWVLTQTSGVITTDRFEQLTTYLTGQTMIYRVNAIGYFGQDGPVARVEAVIDTNRGAPRILYFRDLTELDNPRGFEPPR